MKDYTRSDKWFDLWNGEDNRRTLCDRRQYKANWMQELKKESKKLTGKEKYDFVQEQTVIHIEQVKNNYEVLQTQYSDMRKDYKELTAKFKKLMKSVEQLKDGESLEVIKKEYEASKKRLDICDGMVDGKYHLKNGGILRVDNDG